MRSRIALLLGVAAALIWLSASLTDHLPPPAPPPAVSTPEPVPPPPPAPPPVRVSPVSVRRGDTLVAALKREGFEGRASAQIAAALADSGANLRRLRPEDALEVTWSAGGEPVAVNWEPSPWKAYAVVATDDGWEARYSETTPDVRVEAVSGEVTRSLFAAMEDAGENARLVIGFVEIFESDFDFTADTRQGDRFRLLVEKRYAGDTFVDYGRILVAQYRSEGGVLTAIGFEGAPAGRHGYYDREGRTLRKSFLKSPLEFSRITSGFTYARPHPILGGVRPHLAVDYAAPVGTPVRAVADGTVVAAGWNGGNGIQVRLRHRSGYETVYNHLSKVAAGVRRGVRVRQRQVIGFVGATGLATGSHLDYRVAKHGRFVNPLSEKFIPGEPIPAGQRAAFLDHARDLVHRLEAAAPF